MWNNLIKRLRNPAFFTETSERNLMNEAADALEQWEKETAQNLMLALSIEAGVIRIIKERDEALAKLAHMTELRDDYEALYQLELEGSK